MRYNIEQQYREEKYEIDGGYKVIKSPTSNERK